MRAAAGPDKDTVLCVSLSARPSNFGMTVHNAAYRALGLNYFYKAIAVSDLSGALAGVRAMGIRGCSVSMPFKEASVDLVDHLDDPAQAIGAINTIVNDSGSLTGFNTDAYGAEVVLSRLGLASHSAVLLLGAGGAARAIVYALRKLKFTSIALAGRSPARIASWPSELSCTTVSWAARNDYVADLVVNATPIGMSTFPDESPLTALAAGRAQAVLDLVVNPAETVLIRDARAAGVTVVPGIEMSLHQAARQFELYTGERAPLDVMRASLAHLA